ncbi:LysR family transcriptional regulator [Vibrio metschnikovii]|uniref:LysR family transcriptional regulator n=1 Tax=Vibrio metschnikovii TaxID=28172 RepID=UPI00315D3DBA
MEKTLKYFLMVAIEKNIKQAAEKLYISQPALTIAIQKLEQEIGVELFTRHSKGVELTIYGNIFKEYVQEQQEKRHRLLQKINDIKNKIHGKLKLGTGEAWWELFVCEAVIAYQKNNHSSLHLEFGNNLSLINLLINGDIDLFVGHEIPELHHRHKIHFQPLFQDHEALFVNKTHPLLHQEKQSLLTSKLIDSYPYLRVTPDNLRDIKVLSEHYQLVSQNNQQYNNQKTIYDVNSLSASIDILTNTDSIMPYSNKMCEWMKKKDIYTLIINESKMGTVGIYTNREEINDNITTLVDTLVNYSLAI